MSQNNDQGRPNPSQTWYDNGQVPQSKKFPFGSGNGEDNSDSETRTNPQVDQYGQGQPGTQSNGSNPNFAPPQQNVNQQGGQAPQGATPPYWQQPVNNEPQAPQYGNAQQYGGSQPNAQQYGQPQYGNPGQGQRTDHPTGEQAPHGQYDQQNQGPQGGQYQDNRYQPPYQQNQGEQNRYQQDQFQQNQAQYDQQNPQGSQPQSGGYGQQGSADADGQPQYYSQAQGPYDVNNQGQQNQSNDGQESSDSGNQQFQGILDPHTGEIHPVPDLEGLQDTDALLVVVSGPDSGSQILLDTDVVTVGRSPNADIFLDDVTVSRKHAEFIRTPSGFTLRDTGSLNGTYVGRQLIDSIELQNGADVQIGKFRMIFQQRPRS